MSPAHRFKRPLLAGLTTLLALGPATAFAHHSLTAMYFQDRQLALQGTLVSITVQNPHSSITLDVRKSDGKVERWTAEWGSPSDTPGASVAATVLKAGDTIRITGAPARVEAGHRMLIVAVVRPSDGWKAAGPAFLPGR